MSNNFKVGQKVVQIPKSEWPSDVIENTTPASCNTGHKEGGIYTIKEIRHFDYICGLKFVEVDWPNYVPAACYRPAVDISIFTKMLEQKPKEKVLTMADRDIAMQRGKFQV